MIDELLWVNPRCLVILSMERRVANRIDRFLDEMRKMDHVGGMEITPALQQWRNLRDS
jgi:hypothetical protein